MLTNEEPKSGALQVCKVKVYGTLESLKQEGREGDVDEQDYVIERCGATGLFICKYVTGEKLYFCGEHFEILRRVDTGQVAYWEDETPSSDLEEVARELYSRDIRDIDSVWGCDSSRTSFTDDSAFKYLNLTVGEWSDLDKELKNYDKIKTGDQSEQLAFNYAL